MFQHSRTILLVEDDENDVLLASRAFARVRQTENVVVARSGEDALDYLFRRGHHADVPSDLPGVIVLDLKLPGLSGFDVLRQIKSDERLRVTPVVVYSISDDEAARDTCYSLGANAVVHKPLDLDEFGQTTESIAHFWIGYNARLNGYDD